MENADVSPEQRPWLTPWPEEEIEFLGQCPVCGSRDRAHLLEHAVDNVFFCAPGIWQLWRCTSCANAYLDPRPTARSIHLAYERYYTHSGGGSTSRGGRVKSTARRLIQKLMGWYASWRYQPPDRSGPFWRAVPVWCCPPLRKIVDSKHRHLRPPFARATLLDVGCGSGAFVELAQRHGWAAVGLEPDRKAVAFARSRGLDVHEGTLESFVPSTAFDAITLSHVIEHVHDPVSVLNRARTFLKPGGRLWIETPNVDSHGFKVFREDWRGLECPRHLVLFSRAGLGNALHRAGFRAIQDCSRPGAAPGIFRSSYANAANGLGGTSYSRLQICLFALQATLQQSVLPQFREFITMRCEKVTERDELASDQRTNQ